ncbi:type II secretion system F family protein [Ferrimonas pelagia]|uniref:Type II secretion system F family protein n=1 Tax=Ferrimonas pelagia TaxID=1177826 RepID=A0ABP9FJI6_9GAMM
MIFYLSLLALSLVLLVLAWRDSKVKHPYLERAKTELLHHMQEDELGVNFAALYHRNWWQQQLDAINNLYQHIGKLAWLKILVTVLALGLVSIEFNRRFVRGDPLLVAMIVIIAGLGCITLWLKKREFNTFNQAFPDALNMLASAVSSGESLVHAIRYVGDTMTGPVGSEFKRMSQRLQIGENPDEVFRKSCQRFPYNNFYFFVITLRANMNQGGQLKEIISRLNRLMFNARTIEKKKLALTSEARGSAKIVAAIPFLFLIMMQYISPENYEFVMFSEAGRPILYYVLISEAIGLGIITLLMKGVK